VWRRFWGNKQKRKKGLNKHNWGVKIETKAKNEVGGEAKIRRVEGVQLEIEGEVEKEEWRYSYCRAGVSEGSFR